MGEVNLSELPTLKVQGHGLPLPPGLRNVLIGAWARARSTWCAASGEPVL